MLRRKLSRKCAIEERDKRFIIEMGPATAFGEGNCGWRETVSTCVRRPPQTHARDMVLGGHPKTGTQRAATSISGAVGADEDVGHVEGRGRGNRSTQKVGNKVRESVHGGRALGTTVSDEGAVATVEHHDPPFLSFGVGSCDLKPHRAPKPGDFGRNLGEATQLGVIKYVARPWERMFDEHQYIEPWRRAGWIDALFASPGRAARV